MKRILYIILITLCIVPTIQAQNRGRWMRVRVDKGTPTLVDTLEGVTITAKRKGKQWRKYYKLVHNFSKAYPYALVAKEIMSEVDSTIATDNLKKRKRNQYINSIQKDLFEIFEDPLRHMTITQGKLLLRLIDRETGITPYEIIKTYKNGAAATFWQGIAKIFGSDMKIPYDPDDYDKDMEELVILYQKGEFNKLYRSIFGKNPPEPIIKARNDFPQL